MKFSKHELNESHEANPIKATIPAAVISAQAGEVGAADYRQNPFTLVPHGIPGDANLTDEQIAKLPFDLYRQGYHCY